MKKNKTQKGITLVALIITIIVLLILAVVAISAVQDDGIIQYAKNARTDYEAAQARENTLLGNYVNYIKDNVGSSTGDEDSSGDTGEPGDTGDSTEIVIVDSNGTHILHVLGQKYQIGDTTTWNDLATCAIPVVVEDTNGYATIEGHGFWKIDYYFDADFEHGSPDLYVDEVGDNYVVSTLNLVMVDLDSGAPTDGSTGWITDRTVNTVQEVAAFEGFEENALYLEEDLPTS